MSFNAFIAMKGLAWYEREIHNSGLMARKRPSIYTWNDVIGRPRFGVDEKILLALKTGLSAPHVLFRLLPAFRRANIVSRSAWTISYRLDNRSIRSCPSPRIRKQTGAEIVGADRIAVLTMRFISCSWDLLDSGAAGVQPQANS